MKKLLASLFLVMLVSVTLSSCKKGYVCECDTKDEFYGVQSLPIESTSKSKAESACEDMQIVQRNLNPLTDCTLKSK